MPTTEQRPKYFRTTAEVQASLHWTPPTGTLGALVASARERVAELRAGGAGRGGVSAGLITGSLPGAPPPGGRGERFREALAGRGGAAPVSVIAEIKRRSPSRPEIAPGLDAGAQAAAYAGGGAAAISVLTEPTRFGGSLDDLHAAASAGVPLLRKDFIVDRLQIAEAAAHGAAAVLLIVRALPPHELRQLLQASEEFGLATVVEVHAAGELDVALEAGASIVGVNSRDLESLEMLPDVPESLIPRVPRGVVAVYESGVRGRADVERAAALGADAVLVGTAVSQSPDPAQAVRELAGVPRGGARR